MNFPLPFLWTQGGAGPVVPPVVPADVFTKLLLHCDGSGTDFVDSSITARRGIGTNGAAMSTAQQKFGTSSALFDGVDDYIALSDSTDWAFGNGDFTIDCWVRPTNVNTSAIFGQFAGSQNNVFSIGPNAFADGAAGSIGWVARNSGAVIVARYNSTAAVVTTGVWQHVAWERQGSTFRCYVNGTSVPLTTTTAIGTSTLDDIADRALIGLRSDGAMPYAGHLDELRISKGIARYGGVNFTPPTAAYPDEVYALQQSIILASPWAQYLSNPGAWSARTNQRKGTVSVWFKRNRITTYQNFIQGYDGSSSLGNYLQLGSSNNRPTLVYGGGAANTIEAAAAITDTTTWHHVFFAWDSTQATAANRAAIYIDGVVQTLSVSNYPPLNQLDQMPTAGYWSAIGSQYDGTTGYFDGKLADFYFIDGQTLTPADFTTGTGAACRPKLYTGTFGANGQHYLFSNSNGEDAGPTNRGRAVAGTSFLPLYSLDVPGLVPPTAPTYSIKLIRASNQYMSRNGNPTATNRTKGTFSWWFKRSTIGVAHAIFGGYNGTSDFASSIWVTAANRVEFIYGSDAVYSVSTNVQFTDTNVWHHACVVWDTNQATATNRVVIYVDGVAQAILAGSAYPPLGYGQQFMMNNFNNIIGALWEGSNPWDGQLADIYFIDGQMLAAAAFITGTGVGTCHPIPYAGSYGNVGFHLRFDTKDVWDMSPNGLHFYGVRTPTYLTDVPT